MQQVGSQLLATVMVLAIVMGPALGATWLILRRRRQARLERRSPLSTQLLRTPGHTLREQLEDGRVDIAFDLVLLMVVPGMALGALYAHVLATGRPTSTVVVAIALVGVLMFSAIQIRSLVKRHAQMDQWRLGLDAEMAAGQELDQLMRQGAHVFHDLAGDKFNIDHVVIAPQGVFSVETKGYRKPNRGAGPDDATVVYDGKALKFPDWSSDKPLQQAQRQARWLGEWLTSATGERTDVTPVLALPGWFVQRQGRGPVIVHSGAELRKHLLKARDSQPLSTMQMQRLAHQVEQRCRDVKPRYRPDED